MKIWQTAILVWLMLCGAALGQTGTRTFSVGTYGAIPDDGNPDTDAIQKAIEAAEDYAAAHSTRATVFFPKGSYHITWLEIDRPNITLDGYDARLEAVSGSGFNQILLVTGEADSETAEYIVIKGLAIDGNYPTVDNAGVGLGVNIRANHVKLLDVTVEATENDTFTSQYCQDIVYERCVSRDAGETGFRIRSDYTKVLDCEVYDWNAVDATSGNRGLLVDSLEMDAEEFVVKGLKAEMNEVRNTNQVLLIDGGDGGATADTELPFANSGVATNNSGRASWKLDPGHGFKPGDGIKITGTGQSAYDDISHRIYSIDGECFIGVVDANTFKLYDSGTNAVTNGATGRYDITGTGTGDFYIKSPGSLRKLFTVADQSADTFTCTNHGFNTGMPARLTVSTSTAVLPAGLTGVATVTVAAAYTAAGTSGDYIRPKRINNVTLEDIEIFHQAPDTTENNVIKINNTNNLAIDRLRIRQTPQTGSVDNSSLHLGGGNRKITINDSVLPGGISNNIISWIPELSVTNSEIGSHDNPPSDTLKNLQVGKLTLDGNTIRFANAAIETADSSVAWRDADIDQWKIINNIFEGKHPSSTSVICLRINNDNSNFVSSGKLVWYNNIRRNATYTGLTFTAATTDIISATGHALVTGDVVTVSTSGTLPSGLSANTPYYVRRTGDGVLTLHTTLTGASDNTARVDIADTGSGTHKLLGESVGCLFTGVSSGSHYFGTDYRNRLFYQRGVTGREFEAPTVPSNATVAYTKGDIIWQMNPVPGGSLGWLCTKTGTPGSSPGEFQAMPSTAKTYNIVDYGARPDDAIEDTTAIQAAIDAAEADAPAIVFCPPGEYQSLRTIIDGNDVTVMAYGAVFNQYGSLGVGDGVCMMRILGDRNRVLGLEIDGGGQDAALFATSNNRGIQINGGSENILRDCYIHDTSKYLDGTLSPGSGTGQLDHDDNISQAADTFQIIQADNNQIINCISVNAGWNGIRCSGDGNRVVGCVVNNYLGRGIRFNGGESGYIIGCNVKTEGIPSGAGILVDPEEGELFGTFVIRDCRMYNDSTRAPGTNAVKIARVRYAVIDGGDYEIGPTQPSDNTCIRLEDTVEHCVIQNLRADAVLMTNGLFQAVAASHASAASGTQTTITIDPTSLSADTDFDTVTELLADGDAVLGNNNKVFFISGSSIPAYNGMHTLDDTVAITDTTFTIDTPFVAGTFGSAAIHDATDHLTIRNVQFGHGIHSVVTPLENIKGRIIDIEGCEFDLADSDGDASTGATTAIEWAVPDDRAFSLFRVVNCKAHFHKNGGAIGKLIQMEELTTTLLTSGKTVGFGNIVENHATGGGTPVIVNVTGNADRLKFFTTAGENARQFTGTAAPTAGTWAAGDLVFNTSGASQAVLFWRCATAGTPGTWEAITPTIRGALDANLGSISNGQGIAWNSSTNKFDPVTISGGTAVTTPDGSTTVSRSTEYPVTAYGASGSNADYYGTTSGSTLTTKDSAGSATAHDFVANQGIVVIGAGAACTLTAPQLTVSGATASSGTTGGTAYNWTFNDGTDVCTITGGGSVPAANGDPVRVSSDGTLPTGAGGVVGVLSSSTTYYVRRATGASPNQMATYTLHATSGGAIANTGLIQLTGGSGTHTIVGYTQHTYTARALAADGSATAASTAIDVYNWKMTYGTTSNYNQLMFHAPRGSVALVIYGPDTSSRDPMLILESKGVRVDTTDVDACSFDTVVNDGSGFLQFTASASHGLVTGNIVEVEFTSSGDSAFSAQGEITNVATNVITTDIAWNAGMTSGSGLAQLATVTFRDYGSQPPVNAYSWFPAVEADRLDWRSDVAAPMGSLVLDSTGNRLWRCYARKGSRLTDHDGTPTEPTWTATANAEILDNEVLWRRVPVIIPMDDTSGATSGILFTTVSATPTSSTITLTDAPGTAVSTNALCVMHNDALAFRAARNAIVASGKGGTLKVPPGVYNIILPSYDNTSYWTQATTGVNDTFSFLVMSGGDTVYDETIDVDAYGATVRVMTTCSSVRVDAVAAGANGIGDYPAFQFFNLGSYGQTFRGGTWIWDEFTGGITCHDTAGACEATDFCWFRDHPHLTSTTQLAEWTTMRDMTVFGPSIWTPSGITESANYALKRRIFIDNCHWWAGGGDGNQIGGLHYGDLTFVNGSINQDRYLASNGFYFSQNKTNVKLANMTFRFLNGPGKSLFQTRSDGGIQRGEFLQVINVHCEGCSIAVFIGDSSSSNRVHNITINNMSGMPKPLIKLAECRDVQIIGGDYGSIQLAEDCERVALAHLTANELDLSASAPLGTDICRNITVDDVDVTGRIDVGNVTGLYWSDVRMSDPHTMEAIRNAADLSWIQIGSTTEYYAVSRATGGDPSITSPGYVQVGNTIGITAQSVGSISGGGFGYADPASLGYSTLIVDTAGEGDPDSLPLGWIQSGTITVQQVGVVLGTAPVEDWTWIGGGVSLTGWSSTAGLVANAFGPTTSLKNIVWADLLFDASGDVSSSTNRMVDFGSTALPGVRGFLYRNCTFRHANGSNKIPIRMVFGRGGDVTLESCKFPNYSLGCDFSGSIGNVTLDSNEIQSPDQLMTVDGTANTLTFVSGQVDLVEADGAPVQIFAGSTSTMPSGLTNGQVYYLRNLTNSTVHTNPTDAGTGASAVDFGTGGPVLVKFLDAADSAVATSFTHTGASTVIQRFSGRSKGNTIRGSSSWKYAQITSNQNDYALHLVDEHFLSSDASRNITGLDQEGVTSQLDQSAHGRRIRLVNRGSFDIVLVHNDSGANSLAENEFFTHTGANVTLSSNESIDVQYDARILGWRTIGN